MKIPDRVDLWRATIFHTPDNPFHNPKALLALPDGGLVTREDKILACGDFSFIRKTYPDAVLHYFHGGFLLPGFIDTHIHYPQARILGGLDYSLLDWLD